MYIYIYVYTYQYIYIYIYIDGASTAFPAGPRPWIPLPIELKTGVSARFRNSPQFWGQTVRNPRLFVCYRNEITAASTGIGTPAHKTAKSSATDMEDEASS